MPKEAVEAFNYHFIAGWGGYPLVGTADQIADKLANLSRLGLDGTLLNFARHEEQLTRFTKEVIPRLEAKGLRKPFKARPVA
ncbi:MAG: hypothetical protein EXR39_05520 [Betaproteobacteria bacterium]|nr:hypothetical protein [Betaproteobacteria bacterium]